MSNSFIKLSNVTVIGVDSSKRAASLRNYLFTKEKFETGNILILNDISFEANHGDRIGVIGKNGCGKSSLLKTIAGIYSIKQGERIVQGQIVPLIEMGVGFDPELSGRQNIKLALCYSGRIADYCLELERQIIDFAELADKIDMPLKAFSSGMVARLAFSCSVLQHPDILLLDEVLATGDAYFVEKSYNFMKKKLDDASITIMVNHSIDAIRSLCNRCVFMDAGAIIAAGEPADIIKLYQEYKN